MEPLQSSVLTWPEKEPSWNFILLQEATWGSMSVWGHGATPKPCSAVGLRVWSWHLIREFSFVPLAFVPLGLGP